MATPPMIFVSYCLEDRKWLKGLQVHLRVLEREGMVDLWSDSEIQIEADWNAQIARSLAEANVAILLLSANYLASDFIDFVELEHSLKTRKQNNLPIFSVILTPCSMGMFVQFQTVNDPRKPLEGMNMVEREKVFLRLVDMIKLSLGTEIAHGGKPAVEEDFFVGEEEEGMRRGRDAGGLDVSRPGRVLGAERPRVPSRRPAVRSPIDDETADIFFSYAREDTEFTLRLSKALRTAGADVWLDKDIPAGEHWDLAVEKALKSCKTLLLVLSPGSVASHNVLNEVHYALEEGKRVVPVLYRHCTIPFSLRRVQYIDFTTDFDTALAKLLRDLRRSDSPF